MTRNAELFGYHRTQGVGIRDHIAVIPSVGCVNSLCMKLSRKYHDLRVITHPNGCGHLEEDREQVLRTLIGAADHPNVFAVLVVGLGCENISANSIVSNLNRDNNTVEVITVQDISNVDEFLLKASKVIDSFYEQKEKIKREKIKFSDLVLGVECGGSDVFSGVSANPLIGRISDFFVKNLGSTIISEIPEMIGAEEIILNRLKNDSDKNWFLKKINSYIEMARSAHTDLKGVNPTPGNIRAGLSTIEEKSLGAVSKCGYADISGVLEYSEKIKKKGLHIMDSPGNDPESVTGMVSSGANLILFSTGMGTPYGHPLAPVIKISSNSNVAKKMSGFIDFDAGQILSGVDPRELEGNLLNEIIDVINGKNTKAEINECFEFAISRVTPLI